MAETMLERATAAIEPKFAAMFSGETRRALAEEFARAVIASLREPSGIILATWEKAECDYGPCLWTDFIDAILEEPKA